MPDHQVLAAARAWADGLRQRDPAVVRVCYFGSYARGDYVPGSDLDVLIELAHSAIARRQDRSPQYQPDRFPVGVDIFAYTTDELRQMREAGDAFIRAVDAEAKPLA